MWKWNPFQKNNSGAVSGQSSPVQKSNVAKKKKHMQAEPPKMGMLQRLAMKKLESMSPAEREKLMQKFLTPENIQKNKGQILSAMQQMKASGQITADQYEEAKKRLGV